eukprot:247884-Pelagomonas_calceolata.AAC.2
MCICLLTLYFVLHAIGVDICSTRGGIAVEGVECEGKRELDCKTNIPSSSVASKEAAPNELLFA